MDVNSRLRSTPQHDHLYAGSASSFTMFGTGIPEPIFYTWDEETRDGARRAAHGQRERHRQPGRHTDNPGHVYVHHRRNDRVPDGCG